MANPLHRPVFRRDIKGSGGAYSNPADICADFFAGENLCTHDVACLEAFDPFGLFGARSWKAVFVHPAHLPIA